MSSFIALNVVVEKSEDVEERERQQSLGVKVKSAAGEYVFNTTYVRAEDITRLEENRTVTTDEECTVIHFIDDTTLFTLENIHELRKRIDGCELKSVLEGLFSRRLS